MPPASQASQPDPSEVAARSHDIHTGLDLAEVPEFENLRAVGMAVRLALHIRGLPSIDYQTLRLVATHILRMPSLAVRGIVELLAQVEFVKLQTEGTTIKAVVPNVPYYETLYSTLGTYATDADFNEAEQLSIQLLCHLSRAPEKLDTLRSMLGAENKLLTRAIDVGKAGAYVRVHRRRGRDVRSVRCIFRRMQRSTLIRSPVRAPTRSRN